MTKWTNVTENSKYGVVIYSFSADFAHALKLTIGDSVLIFKSNEDWFFGCLVRNRSQQGVFPKSYIAIRNATVDRSGGHENVVPCELPIVQEITSVLREWSAIWKQLYVNNNSNFEQIRNMMYEMIDWRKQIMSGTLPVDELKELKQKVTSKIDIGNLILGLDLIVRDSQGNLLNPDITSTIELYRAHEATTDGIQKMLSRNLEESSHRTSTRYIHSLFVTLKNFVCRVGDDADLLMTLYDAKENKFISENYLVRWSKEGLTKDLDQLHNLRVLFTDLGSKDLQREKVFLVCQIIRIGAMEMKEVDHRKSMHSQKRASEGVRRPFGVAVMDVSDYIHGKLEGHEETQRFVPFVPCGDHDFLEGVMRKVLSAKEISHKEHKNQGLWVCIKMLHGDLKQMREENPRLVALSTTIARKMGFPEVILPGDVRNDLYLTLELGEFHKGNKATEKNVEVTVKVLNEKGHALTGVISLGAGCEPMNDYRSVIYYHEDKPKWMETFKVAIPIEEFYNAHLLFTFRHRSSNETKDRAEKIFAMSFVKLMQENGTTLSDEVHDLLVYRVDPKKFVEADMTYLSLPSTRSDVEMLSNQGNMTMAARKCNLPHLGITLNLKDLFLISTLVCSTKLTQNVPLLGLLKCNKECEDLRDTLQEFMKVDGEEVVKFLQDTLDVLFRILMENPNSEVYDTLVVEALVFLLGLISDRKYQHFRPVLDVYIQENFSATLAYDKLISVLKYYVENANVLEKETRKNVAIHETLLKIMKCIEYIFKFIVRSRLLFAALNEGKGSQQFENSLKQLLKAISDIMLYDAYHVLTIQGVCLKYFPFAIPDILLVFDGKELSLLLINMIDNIQENRLTKQKLICISDIIHSELFTRPECRAVLLPAFLLHLRYLLERNEDAEMSIQLLSDILTLLHMKDYGPTIEDFACINADILRTVIQSVISMDRSSALVANLVAIMVAIFREMTPYHYNLYMETFATRTDMLDFLMEILMVFQDLVGFKSVYRKDWCDMIMLQNSIILKALRYFSKTIQESFTKPFEIQVWNNFFHCAISFLTQKSLQLENFSQNKRNKIISRHKDMRREAGFEIRSLWFRLGANKIQFVPDMVGPFLEMTLIPESELRKATIPMFFDMMQSEFYSYKEHGLSLHEEFFTHNRDIKGNFRNFENEMITQLDKLVEGGRGDESYKELFLEIMTSLCENHATLWEQGMRFVQTAVRLMRRLLEYRDIVTDENKENQMSCTVNLLEFYDEINRKEMYIRYLYKLCDLHLECDNYVEAAFTLKLHSRLLRWNDDPLPPPLRHDKYPDCETHRELKQQLYLTVIHYFDKGKLWEAGLQQCKELAELYENEIFDYVRLGEIYKQMSHFYDNIMKQMRPEPEYFRVGFFGKGFPSFLQNKVFIYRGKSYERLSDFQGRLQNQFPRAQLVTKLVPPSEEITESPHQFLQINKVDPVMHQPDRFQGKAVSEQILKYYRVNEVSKFSYSRRVNKGDSDNEFANIWLERTTLETAYSLPGILRWFPVRNTQVHELRPLEVAIETMDTTNKNIRESILSHRADSNLPINPLSLLVSGVVDAAVMGGISNYEKAFFTDEYLDKNNNPKDAEEIQTLKDLIASQIPLLEASIAIHKRKAPESLKPLHEHIEVAFSKMKKNVEEQYGQRSIPIELQEQVGTSAKRSHHLSSLSMTPILQERTSSTSLQLPESPQKPGLRAQSVFVKPGTMTLGKNHNKKNRDSSGSTLGVTLRRSSAAASANGGAQGHGPSSASLSEKSQSQWYDQIPSNGTNSTPNGNLIELSEQLTPHRPLRSEAERRHSRPSSGHYRRRSSPSPVRQTLPLSSPCTPTRRREDSTVSSTSDMGISGLVSPACQEDDKPPPLPQKQAYNDYSNLTDDVVGIMNRKSSLSLPTRIKNKPPPPLPVRETSSPSLMRTQRPLEIDLSVTSISPVFLGPGGDTPPELPKKPPRIINQQQLQQEPPENENADRDSNSSTVVENS